MIRWAAVQRIRPSGLILKAKAGNIGKAEIVLISDSKTELVIVLLAEQPGFV